MATAAFAKLTGAVDNGKSYNVEKVLRSNIVYSDYYRQLCKVTDFMTLVDEMYNEVTHVEPWMSGNARGPSTAFCILYRLFTLAPTVASEDGDGETQMLEETQIAHLLNHGDSPYIRAIRFLYLRYVCPHKKLIRHLEPYFADDERFAPSADPNKETTVGAFVRDLVLDQYYFETLFPRIPEVTRRDLVRAIRERGFAAEPVGLGGLGGPSRRGDDGRARPQSVKAALSVNVGQRAPHVKGAIERGRGFDAGSRARDDGWDRGRRRDADGRGGFRDRRRDDRDRSRDRSRDRDRGRHHPYGGGGARRERRGSRSRSRDRARDGREGGRYGGETRDDAGAKGAKKWYE